MLLFSLNLRMVGFRQDPKFIVQSPMDEEDEQELLQLISMFLEGRMN